MIKVLLILASLSLAHAKTFLFVHGGPGYNSNPEASIMKSHFTELGHEIEFWNELGSKGSTATDPNVFTTQAIKSLNMKLKQMCRYNKKLNVIAHSFGVNTLNQAMKLSGVYCIKRIFLIAPALGTDAINKADMNIIDAALADFTNALAHDDAIELKKLKDLTVNENGFTNNRLNALIKALQDQALQTHYWVDMSAAMNYFSFMTGDHAVDVQSFVLQRFGYNTVQPAFSFEKTFMILGEKDEIVTTDVSDSAKSFFNIKRRVRTISNAGHFPHIEKTKVVVNYISSKAK